MWSGETGLKSRGDLRRLDLNWPPRVVRVGWGLKEGGFPGQRRSRMSTEAFRATVHCPKETVGVGIGKAGYGHTVKHWSAFSL